MHICIQKLITSKINSIVLHSTETFNIIMYVQQMH